MKYKSTADNVVLIAQIKQLLPKGIAVGKINLEREFIVRTKVRKQSYSADVSNKVLLQRIARDWGIQA